MRTYAANLHFFSCYTPPPWCEALCIKFFISSSLLWHVSHCAVYLFQNNLLDATKQLLISDSDDSMKIKALFDVMRCDRQWHCKTSSLVKLKSNEDFFHPLKLHLLTASRNCFDVKVVMIQKHAWVGHKGMISKDPRAKHFIYAHNSNFYPRTFVL